MDINGEAVHNWIMNEAEEHELKQLQDLITLKLRLQLRVGTRVQFDAKTRGIIHGVITKVNGKTIKVQADGGAVWTVGPGLLQREVV